MFCTTNFNSTKDSLTNKIAAMAISTKSFKQLTPDTLLSIAKDSSTVIGNINNIFGEQVLTRTSPDYSFYTITPSKELVNEYLGIKQAKILLSKDEKVKLINDHASENISSFSENQGLLSTYLNFPEVSEMTYEKLVDFLKKLNPDVRIETIDNLSQSGQAYVKDFLVRVNSFDRFKQMPEEVAHFFVELLPKDSDLLKDMLSGIINFPIYSQTFDQYKGVYTNENGTPDINRIKHEAAAKLIAEYIYALSSGDKSRLNSLTKVKQGWVKTWLNKFLKWIGLSISDNTKVYADIASQILAGDIDTSLNERASEDEISDKVWLKLTNDQMYSNALKIYELNPPRLLETIQAFRREFNDKFIKILKDDKFQDINKLLKVDPTDEDSLNKLDEFSQLLKGIKIDLQDETSALDSIQGIVQFLQVLDRLSVLSEAIYDVTINKENAQTFAEAVNNIRELESYFSLFESFNRIVSRDLVDTLITQIGKGKDAETEGQKHPGRDLIETINRTRQKFNDVNSFIIDKLEGNFSIFFKEILKDTNDNISKELMADLEREEAKESPNKQIIGEIKRKLNTHIQSDEKIIKMLSNRGSDIDFGSNFNHLIGAAITNGNMYVAGIVKYIQSHLYVSQSKAVDETTTLFEEVDKIEKELGESVYDTGKAISSIEEQYDPTTETGKREVLVFLNPFKGASLAKSEIKNELDELRRKIPKDKNSPDYQPAIDALVTKTKEYEDWQQKYMNRPYTKEFYTLQSQFDTNPKFNEIWNSWKMLTNDIYNLEEIINNGQGDDDTFSELILKRREKAFLLQETDESNNPKTPEELEKVMILKDYFDKGSKFREIDELQTERAYNADLIRYQRKLHIAVKEVEAKNLSNIKDVEKALRVALKDSRLRISGDYTIETSNSQEAIDYDLVAKLVGEKWIVNNNVITPNQRYWDDIKLIQDLLNDLQQKGELSPLEIMEKNLYEEKRNLLFGYRNEQRQIDPTIIPQEKIDRINDIDFELEELKKSRPKTIDLSEFSPEDKELYEKYLGILNNPTASSKDFMRKLQAQRKLYQLQKKYKNSDKSNKIKEAFEMLSAMSSKIPTDYYWDKMDLLLEAFDSLITEFKQDADKDTMKELMNYYYAFEEALNNSDSEAFDFDVFETQFFSEFLVWMEKNRKYNSLHEWFINNHLEKTVWDNRQDKYVKLKYVRSSIYTQTIPNEEEHREYTHLKKHIRRRVKNEYRTGYNPATGEVELKVGEHIDNKNEWLPLSVEQGQTDRKYINEDYYKLKNSKDPKDILRFKYLQKLIETNLSQQDKVDPKLRKWMNVPVMELDHLEEKQYAIKNAPDTIKQGIEKVKGLFKKNENDDADSQIEGMDTTEDIDAYTGQIIKEKIPKLGMSQKLPVSRVSKNLLGATAAFIQRANEFEGRTQAQPLVSALIRLFKNNNLNENLNGANNKQISQIFEKLYSQMILEEVPDSLTNNRFIKRATKIISSTTGLRLLMDIPGGLINYGSAQINNLIEASAGQHMTMRDYAKGNYLAGIMIRDIVADYSKKSGLSYYTLLFDTFDFIQGEFQEDLISRSSSMGKMAAIKSHMMLPRKGGELHAQSATALGIMNKVKVKNQIDGKEYPLHEIYKAEGNKLILKEGFYEIDADGNKIYPYNPIDGVKYLNVKKLINRVNLELHGNYAKINQTEASRHSIGKLVENMKRWFVSGFTRRWGRELPDITYEGLNEGYYLTGMKALYNVFLKNLLTFDIANTKDWWNYYASNPRYKANLLRMGTDIATWGLIFFGFAVGLGYSGDDKDKNLKENSWISQMAILTLIRMYSEATAYFPVPSMGLQELKRNLFSPLSLPMDTFSNAAAVAQLGLYQIAYAMGDESLQGDLYYSKDGGYWFSEKGDSKLVKYMLKSIGYNGYFLEPGQYVKDFTKLQGRLK